MNSTQWNAFLASLPADRREELGIVIERITKIVDEMRSYTIDQIQRVERRQDGLSQRQADQVARADRYEEQQARHVRTEIDRMLGETITREEYDALMTAVFELTTRIEKLEPLADLLVRVQAVEQRLTEWQIREQGGDA